MRPNEETVGRNEGTTTTAGTDAAWRQLQESIVRFRGEPVGTVASGDDEACSQNYDQVFTRDFFVSALAFLLRGEYEIVRRFLCVSLDLQSAERHMDCFRPGQGMMPASFLVSSEAAEERIEADFGEHAIARVTPIDSGFWWLYLLHAYTRASGDQALAQSEAMQRGIRLILDLCLPPRHEMLPTLLVPDGSFMIDRRLGVYGHPLDIQVLFHMALRAADGLLDAPEDDPLRQAVRERESHLAHHLRTYYWLDMAGLNRIYRYEVEELGENAANRFNIYPETLPTWLFDWMPREGGYFAGNLGPARLDVRFFSLGNLLSILGGLADTSQAEAIIKLFRGAPGRPDRLQCLPAVSRVRGRLRHLSRLPGLQPGDRTKAAALPRGCLCDQAGRADSKDPGLAARLRCAVHGGAVVHADVQSLEHPGQRRGDGTQLRQHRPRKSRLLKPRFRACGRRTRRFLRDLRRLAGPRLPGEEPNFSRRQWCRH